MRLSGTKTGAINQYRGLGNQLWDLAGNRPSLDLPFADNKSLVDATTGANLVDFTRASSGTYVDSEGVIRTATTNLLLRSEEFYIWGAQLEQSTTVGEYIPTTSTINSAPRFDHDPTTGESLGLLVEEQRTKQEIQLFRLFRKRRQTVALKAGS
jgi:hypothetical protein